MLGTVGDDHAVARARRGGGGDIHAVLAVADDMEGHSLSFRVGAAGPGDLLHRIALVQQAAAADVDEAEPPSCDVAARLAPDEVCSFTTRSPPRTRRSAPGARRGMPASR